MSMLYDDVQMDQGIPKFWNWCGHYQDVYEYHHKLSGLWFILTQQSKGENEYGKSGRLYIFTSLKYLKPKYSFGKWWKWKISLMGIVHKSCMSSQSPVNLFVRNHQFS